MVGLKSISKALLVLAAISVAGCASKSVYEAQADREGIRNTVKAHFAELRKCYYEALDQEPLLEGKLVLSWEVSSDGRADQVEVKEASPKIQPVAPCVVERLKAWQFPKPTSSEVVTVERYPFFFSENGKFPTE